MKKLISAVLVFLFALNILFTPSSLFAQNENPEKVDVYALFWPIIPGTTVADSMFWTKQIKEGLSGLFTFGDINKAKYEIELSEKRFVEASKLYADKDYSNGLKSLDLNKTHRDQALQLKKKLQEIGKEDLTELKAKFVKSLENQQKALTYIATEVPEDQKNKIESIIKELTLQISEAK